MDVLSVKGLCKRYESFALQDVSFSVQPGRIMGFIGRNGAGKTTTLKCLLDLVHPNAGEICFFGEPLHAGPRDVRQRIGFVSGGVDYYTQKRLSTITDVTRRFYTGWDDAAYARYMRDFELDERKTPEQLSAGMRVKYALALAMSHHAELLILDEPTSGLDPVSRDELLDVFLTLVREGTSILFSTHITSDLDRCADDITYIRKGRILTSEPINAFVARYGALTLAEEAVTPAVREHAIGLKPAKTGYTAIMPMEQAQALGLSAAPADLETIMIHMEKEAAQ